MDACAGRCLTLATVGGHRVSEHCPGEAPNTLCAGFARSSVALRSIWQLSHPQKILLERRPKGGSAAVCVTAAGSSGSPLQLLPCGEASNEVFTSTALAKSAFALQINGLVVGGASEARLELAASNASWFVSSCVPCPAAPLDAGAWVAIALGLLALSLLPRLLARACGSHRRRVRTSDDDDDWPQRGRLEGWPGAVAQVGWLMVIVSLVPMCLALFADAWDATHGVPGWYLTMLPAGAFLLLFMLHPAENAAAMRVVYALAITFFACTFGIGIALVCDWLLTARFGGVRYVALACRDAIITLLSLLSALTLWCRRIRGQARAALRAGFNTPAGKHGMKRFSVLGVRG